MGYTVTHLSTNETFTRPWLLINNQNQAASHQPEQPHTNPTGGPSAIETFHRSLPFYAPTPLQPLPTLASKLGIKALYLKNEGTRFGLPSFKILGATWAIHRSVCAFLGLDAFQTSFTDLQAQLAAQQHDETTKGLKLLATTEGNWGRAVARMGNVLGLPVKLYVPFLMGEETRALLRSEGAEVIGLSETKGSYDDALDRVRREAQQDENALLVMDMSWEGYEEVPGWVSQGYTTLLHETTRQLPPDEQQHVTHAIAAVGVGSWAQAVVSYYRSPTTSAQEGKSPQIITVEPSSAPSFKESLHMQRIKPIATSATIMNGMNCGTTSRIAWPVLREGVDVAVVVTDREAHESVLELSREEEVEAGPCGAATLAALRKMIEDSGATEERREWVVVLFCTEGKRGYDVPV